MLQTTQRKGRNELGGGAKEKLGEVLMVMVEGLRELVIRYGASAVSLPVIGDPLNPFVCLLGK